ncbi:hypothetical protein C8R47DRAFT_1199221 [Mycena vitilis]|nr:hypothetical protein C8R47DRAFT_1199221 [Mycena vitilis]
MAPTRSGQDYLVPERGESPILPSLSDLTSLGPQMASGTAPASSDSEVPAGTGEPSERNGVARGVSDASPGGPSATSEQSERASVARDITDVSPDPSRSYASVVGEDGSSGHSAAEAGQAHVADMSHQSGVELLESASNSSRRRVDGRFKKPRKSARRSSIHSQEPIESKPRFFPEWFESSDNDSEEDTKVEKGSDAVSWCDLPEDDIGELPSWKGTPSRDVKIEEVTPRLTPIDRVVDQVYQQADTPTRKALNSRMRYNARKGTVGNGPDDSDSDTDSGSHTSRKGRRSRGSLKRNRKSPAKSIVSETTTVAMANRIPMSQKGKGIDPAERSGKPPATPEATDSESDSEEDYIKADYLAAERLQERLYKEAEEALSLQEDFVRREEEFWKQRDARISREAELRAQVETLKKRLAKKARQRETRAEKRASSPEVPKESPGKADKGQGRRDKSASKGKKARKHKDSDERKKPQKYRQASAKLPRGSRLSRAMRGGGPSDSDSSSESDSSSSTDESRWKLPEIPTSSDEESMSDYFPEEPDSVHSSDSELTKSAKRRAKRRYKEAMVKMKFQQGFLKADPPFVYNGEAKADLFNKWVREVRNFAKLGFLSPRQAVKMIGKYLGGKAYRWYDRDVLNAKKKIKWTFKKFFTALFDEVFPADFRAKQHDLFDGCEQGSRKVKDFMQNLQDLANTVGNLSDADIVLAFWHRCETYLRVEFTRLGYEAETISLKQLMRIAEREERVHLLIEEERRKAAKKSGDRDNGKKQEKKDRPAGSSKDESRSDKPVDDKKKKDQKKTDYRNSREQKDVKKKSDKDRKKRLRDEGLCFNCEGSGHLSKDCPKAQKVPAPAARAARVDFVEIERLKAVKLANKLGLMAMYPVEPWRTPEWNIAFEEVLMARARAELADAVPFILDNLDDFDPEHPPDALDRFFVYSTGDDEFAIVDHHQGLDYTVPKKLLAMDDFDLVDWIKWQMTEKFELRRTQAYADRAESIAADHSSEAPALQSVTDSDEESDSSSCEHDWFSRINFRREDPDSDDPDMPALRAVTNSSDSDSEVEVISESSGTGTSLDEESSLNFTDSEGTDLAKDVWSNVFEYCVDQANGGENSPLMDAIANELGWSDYVNSFESDSGTDASSESMFEREEFSHHIQRIWNDTLESNKDSVDFVPCSDDCENCSKYALRTVVEKPTVRVSAAKPKKATIVPDKVERNASREKKPDRVVPMPIVVIARINGEPVRAVEPNRV